MLWAVGRFAGSIVFFDSYPGAGAPGFMLSPASRAAYSTNNPVDWLANIVLPEDALTYTVLIPLHVSGATEYAIDTNLLSPPLNEITDEAITVSTPQLETAEIVTV